MAKNKILLVSPSVGMTRSTKAVHRFDPPLSLVYIATFMIQRGYECEIVETALNDIDWKKIETGEYLLVGMSVYIGEFMKTAEKLSKKIKELAPDLPIVWGGVMPTVFYREMLEQYHVDYIVRYEGENTLFELAEAINGKMAFGGVKGISFKKDGAVIRNEPRLLENNLDNFPIPDWTLLGDNFNRNQTPYYYKIMSSKGCPFNCSFCYNLCVDPEISRESPKWRYRSAEHVIEEIRFINSRTGGNVFSFGDDNALANKSRVNRMLSFMRDNNYYVEQIIGHLNHFTDAAIKDMGGVVQTALYSIESASTRLHKILNKNINLEKVIPTNKKLTGIGIVTIHSFIAGLPTETDEDLRMNVEIMLELKRVNPFARGHSFFFYPVPHTPITGYIENELGYNLPKDLTFYEYAEFYFGLDECRPARPWLSPERYNFIGDFNTVFNDAFKTTNMELSGKSVELLNNNKTLKNIFRGIENVNRPKEYYDPYVLDRVLRGEKIDLYNDIKKYCTR